MSESSRRQFIGRSTGPSIERTASAALTSCPPELRLFSDGELDVLATPLSIRLERAALARDAAAIDEIREQMDLECLAIYDSYMQWVAVLQTFILSRTSELQHDEALRQMAEHAFRDHVLAYRGIGFREHVRLLAGRLRASGSTFSQFAECDDRVRFEVDPLGAVRQWRAGKLIESRKAHNNASVIAFDIPATERTYRRFHSQRSADLAP